MYRSGVLPAPAAERMVQRRRAREPKPASVRDTSAAAVPNPCASSPHSPTQALLKRLRARGLSQTEISRRTHIPQPRLSRWEAGDVAAGADDALRLQALEDELEQPSTEADEKT